MIKVYGYLDSNETKISCIYLKGAEHLIIECKVIVDLNYKIMRFLYYKTAVKLSVTNVLNQ